MKRLSVKRFCSDVIKTLPLNRHNNGLFLTLVAAATNLVAIATITDHLATIVN